MMLVWEARINMSRNREWSLTYSFSNTSLMEETGADDYGQKLPSIQPSFTVEDLAVLYGCGWSATN